MIVTEAASQEKLVTAEVAAGEAAEVAAGEAVEVEVKAAVEVAAEEMELMAEMAAEKYETCIPSVQAQQAQHKKYRIEQEVAPSALVCHEHIDILIHMGSDRSF